MKLKSYILNRFAHQDCNYQAWMSDGPLECVVVEDHPPKWEIPDDAGIVITHMHYRWEEMSALRRIYETTSVPILILADGVIEYRNTWENPTIADGAMFQPLVGHKLACIGGAQARAVESWGNVGKCEIVGLPRFDDAFAVESLPVQSRGRFRLLVATANQPSFTPGQRAKMVESLRLIKQRFENNRFVNQRPVELVWRLTDGLAEELGLPVESSWDDRRPSLSDEIEMADAVITTPSTVYLESVLRRRPTAVLDFTNSPAYVPSAWTISAPMHLNQVLCELENSPAAKMQFQRSVLFDQVELGTGSRERLFQLIQTMVAAGVDSRRSGEPIRLPANILKGSNNRVARAGDEFDSISLFPDNPIFRTEAIERLRQELNLAVTRLGSLPAELNQKEDYLRDAKVQMAEVRERESELAKSIAQKSEDITKKNAHIEALNQAAQVRDQARGEQLLKNRQVLATKNTHIDSLNQMIQESKEVVGRLRSEIERKTEKIESLKAVVNETQDAINRLGSRLSELAADVQGLNCGGSKDSKDSEGAGQSVRRIA